MLRWISLRRYVSYRSLSALLVVSTFAASLVHLHTPLKPVDGVVLSLSYTHESGNESPRVSERDKERPPPLARHTFLADGRLLVNPDAPHPIFQLMQDAEAAWDEKRARASTSLDEAVAEYRRRYRRAPPLGFDKWWDYVVKHHVQLPDEYDEIFEDIEPFWGIDPHDLATTQQELENYFGVVTVEKTAANPRFEVIHSTLPKGREGLQTTVEYILALVHEVEHDLPPLRMTFSPFDNPDMLSDWKIKSMALEAAANGTTLTRAEMPSPTAHGWIQACPPDSPARRSPPAYPPSENPPHSSSKTFVTSHRDAMDPCMQPSLFTMHGQFLTHKIGPAPRHTMIPRFSLCATLLHHDIRPPVPYGWDFDSEQDNIEEEDDGEGGAFHGDVPWERKANEKLAWRGRITGIYASPDTWWLHGQRARLVTLTNAFEGNVSVLRVSADEHKIAEAGTKPVGEPESMLLAQVNSEWMDIAFADRPLACDDNRGTCDQMAQMWKFQKMQGRQEEGQYKFILDVDGNGWSGRFKRLMTSNALVFKTTIYPEWYTSKIAPWVHYVPIQVSYADLYDAVAFFRVHDALARRIARAGRAWSRQFWRRADLTAYFYRLLLEYARVVSLDRAAMDYVG